MRGIAFGSPEKIPSASQEGLESRSDQPGADDPHPDVETGSGRWPLARMDGGGQQATRADGRYALIQLGLGLPRRRIRELARGHPHGNRDDERSQGEDREELRAEVRDPIQERDRVEHRGRQGEGQDRVAPYSRSPQLAEYGQHAECADRQQSRPPRPRPGPAPTIGPIPKNRLSRAGPTNAQRARRQEADQQIERRLHDDLEDAEHESGQQCRDEVHGSEDSNRGKDA